MSRVRPRNYNNVAVVYRNRPAGRVRNRAKAAALKGQSFHAANPGRVLTDDERRQVEERLRHEGVL